MKLAEHREVPIKPSSLPFIPRIILKQRGIDRWLFQLLIVRRKVLKELPSPFVFFNRSTIFYVSKDYFPTLEIAKNYFERHKRKKSRSYYQKIIS